MNYLGIDTSAYTTSLAVVDNAGTLLWEARRVLRVPAGGAGLAQSAAFFQHVQNLPLLVAEMPSCLWMDLAAVGVSMTPRPVAGSYMPVFTAGYAVARVCASAKGIPLVQTSHQEGHLAAGLASAGGPSAKEFLAVHLSGGTTEMLHVRRQDSGFAIEILGGSTDLHAGQFVDRVGVRLGLAFPAGKALERLAECAQAGAAALLPSSVRGMRVSFSGVETAAARLLQQGVSPADVARAVEGCIARTVAKLVRNGLEHTGLSEVLLVGGVAANRYLREELARRLGRRAALFWAVPEWSRDNAIGVALLARQASSGLLF